MDLSKNHGGGAIFGALRAHKMLILLNFAQKSLSCNPPPLGHSEEYSPMLGPDLDLDLSLTIWPKLCVGPIKFWTKWAKICPK